MGYIKQFLEEIGPFESWGGIYENKWKHGPDSKFSISGWDIFYWFHTKFDYDTGTEQNNRIRTVLLPWCEEQFGYRPILGSYYVPFADRGGASVRSASAWVFNEESHALMFKMKWSR